MSPNRRGLTTMTKFNQAKFESEAKKLVAKYLNYQIDEKELSIVGFSKVGADAKVMICDSLKTLLKSSIARFVGWSYER